MLTFMRRQHAKLKWVLVIVIVVLAAGMVLNFTPGDPTAVATSDDVATVGRETVTSLEFQNTYRNYVRNMQQQLSPEIRRAFGLDKQVLDFLIGQKVIANEARRLGLQVTAQEITQTVVTNPVFMAGGSFIGLDRYRELLLQNNLTTEQYEEAIKDELLMRKVLNFVTAGVGITDKEVEEEYRRKNEKAVLSYFIIDPAKLESKVAVTDKEQQDYFEKNKTRYNVAEKRKTRYVHVDLLKYHKDATAEDTELRAYFDEHVEEYRLPEQVSAQHILFKTDGKTPEQVEAIQKKATGVLDRAKKNEDFAKLAKEFSEDTTTGPSGGNLGTFERGRMVPEFEQAAFSMGAGAISDLVRTQYGFHIIKVNEKQETRVRPFEEMKEAVRPLVLFAKAGVKSKEIAEKIAVELITNKDLNAVATKHGATVRETPLLEQSQVIIEFGGSTEYQAKVFAMAKDEIGTALQIQGGLVIPQVTEIQTAHPASFEEARPRVLNDVRSEKARQTAMENSTKVQEQITAGKSDLAALAKLAGSEVKTTEKLIRGGAVPEFGSIAERDQEIFTLAVGKVGTPTTLSGKTLVYAVKEREEIKEEEMKKSMEGLRTEMLPVKRERYFSAYVKEIQKKMQDDGNIAINEAALTAISERI